MFGRGCRRITPTANPPYGLQRINTQLSKLNNNALSRAAKMLTALTD
jgi:hypothetical protein